MTRLPSRFGTLGARDITAALPIAFPFPRNRMPKSGSGDQEILRSIRLPAVVLAPSHFVGVGVQITTRNMMVYADL